jgi:hypothetical protein
MRGSLTENDNGPTSAVDFDAYFTVMKSQELRQFAQR